MIAETEPLECTVGSEFGKKPCASQAVAVTEPLESIIRAGFGKKLVPARWLPQSSP